MGHRGNKMRQVHFGELSACFGKSESDSRLQSELSAGRLGLSLGSSIARMFAIVEGW